jgi:hypothetical protein
MYGAESGAAAVGPGDVPSDRYLEIRVAARSSRDVGGNLDAVELAGGFESRATEMSYRLEIS